MSVEINSMETPLVSIICDCYNHEKYIRDALDGFIMQKTTFAFEVLIHDDASTDKSKDIIEKYAAEYPNIIFPVYQDVNQYSQGVSIWKNYQFSRAKGKYIALCEGDDYWTDPYKLQKQVDFLEENEDYSMCFHRVKIYNEIEEVLLEDFITNDVADTTTIYDLAKGNFIHTLSVIYRNNQKVFDSFDKLRELNVGDYPLHMLNAQYGKIKKMPECMGVYRYGIGIWSSPNDIEFKYLSWLNLLDKLCDYFKGDDLLVKTIKEQYGCRAYMMYEIFRDVDNEKMGRYFLLSVENNLNFVLSKINDSEKMKKEFKSNFDDISSSNAYSIGKILIKPLKLFKNIICLIDKIRVRINF